MDVAVVQQLSIVDKMGRQSKKDSKKVRQLLVQAFQDPKPPKQK